MLNNNITTLALIGKGRWGNNYLKEVVKIKRCEIKYVKTHDYKDLLKYNDIDGIIIATPAETHAEIIQTFPDKFLLVEKPLTTNLTDAKAIINPQIMVGHVYLYNIAMMDRVKKLGRILQFQFILHNTESYGSKVGPIWELTPHPVSLFLNFSKGKVNISYAKIEGGNLTVNMSTAQCTCDLTVGWNYEKKERNIRVVGENGVVEFNGTEINKISPLENQIRHFISFIHGGTNKTLLNEGVKVVELLSKIEKVCMTR